MLEINKIHHGDCIDEMKKLPDNSIDLIIIDPPYSTPVITAFGRKKIKNLVDLSIQEYFFSGLKKEFERVLKPNGRLLIFCDDKFYPILFAVFYDWLNIGLIVWDKERIGMGKPIRKRHELIMYACRKMFEFNQETDSHIPSVVRFKQDKNKVHGAQKPESLLRFLIRGFSHKGDLVLDCFAGSGSTIISARKEERNAIGCELNKGFCDTANSRLSNIQILLAEQQEGGAIPPKDKSLGILPKIL